MCTLLVKILIPLARRYRWFCRMWYQCDNFDLLESYVIGRMDVQLFSISACDNSNYHNCLYVLIHTNNISVQYHLHMLFLQRLPSCVLSFQQFHCNRPWEQAILSKFPADLRISFRTSSNGKCRHYAHLSCQVEYGINPHRRWMEWICMHHHWVRAAGMMETHINFQCYPRIWPKTTLYVWTQVRL